MNRLAHAASRLGATSLLIGVLILSGCSSASSPTSNPTSTAAEPAVQPTTAAPVIITEKIEISGVNAVALSLRGTLIIQFGDAESLTIETDENVLPQLESKVENGLLTLGTKPNQNISPTKLEYRLTLKSLESINVIGSGKVMVTDFMAALLKADIQGSGSIQVSGKTEQLEVIVDGSGSFSGKDLTSTEAKVEISGSGKIQVNATSKLEAEVSGSGDVIYYGDPEVTESVSGSGSITKG